MNIAYIRVSTVDQNEQRQLKAMKKYDINKYYIEKASAKDTNRPQLKRLLKEVVKGDIVYIKDFSRLARSTKDLLEMVEFFKSKGVKLISLKENLDTDTTTGKLMLTMIGAIYEFERANLLERQAEGIEIAKSKGKYKGRKKIERPDNWDEVYNQWKQKEISGKTAVELLGLKKTTFYKLVNETAS